MEVGAFVVTYLFDLMAIISLLVCCMSKGSVLWGKKIPVKVCKHNSPR